MKMKRRRGVQVKRRRGVKMKRDGTVQDISR